MNYKTIVNSTLPPLSKYLRFLAIHDCVNTAKHASITFVQIAQFRNR